MSRTLFMCAKFLKAFLNVIKPIRREGPTPFLGAVCGSPILFSFRLPVCNARYIYIYIYIYIICVPTRNSNNEFILYFILREIKMADFERRQLEFGLEFVRYSFAKRNNLSEGSSERRKDLRVIRVRGAAAPRVFELELLVC